MIGTPPSKRSMRHDPAEHARDLAEQYAGPAMMDPGIPDDWIGTRDPDRNRPHHGFLQGRAHRGRLVPKPDLR